MKPGTIYRKTMIFSWLKLGIGLMTGFVCAIVGAVAWLLITYLQVTPLTSFAIGCAAFLIAVGLYNFVMSRFGYSVKLGHLAIVERAHGGEEIPNQPVDFSKSVLNARFHSSRQYHFMARDLTLAMSQLLRIIARGFSLDSDVPKRNFGWWPLYLLSYPAISCMNECCLTYALRRKDYEVNAACVDALTLLVQNWDAFKKKALKLSLIVILLWLILIALFFLPGWTVAQNFSLSPWPWLGITLILVLTSHFAFIDSWLLTKIVCEYLDIVDASQIESQNYTKLDSWSKTYAKIRKNAKKAAEKAGVNPEIEPTTTPNSDSNLAESHDSTPDDGLSSTMFETDSLASDSAALAGAQASETIRNTAEKEISAPMEIPEIAETPDDIQADKMDKIDQNEIETTHHKDAQK